MVIIETAEISDNKIDSFAWSGLRQFHNISLTAKKHSELLSANNVNQNIKKQASQIRDCLIQSKEYYDAASVVTLATKPVLMYYCSISPALAEILMKGSGDVSLDRARAEHNHHGLNFRLSYSKNNIDNPELSASSLRAVPSIKTTNGRQKRFGTFELWHPGAREYPVPGYVQSQVQDTRFQDTLFRRKSFRTILGGVDERLPEMEDQGINFLDCVRYLPEMVPTIERFGLTPKFVRTHCSAVTQQVPQDYQRVVIMIQPCPNDTRDSFIESIKIAPRDCSMYNYMELDSGGQITIDRYRYDVYGKNMYKYQVSSMPSGMSKDTYNYMFYTSAQVPLNGFGFYYVGLFMLSNYARYYPDLWMNDISRSSPLSIIAEDFLNSATTALPLLALCELSRKYYVREGTPIAL